MFFTLKRRAAKFFNELGVVGTNKEIYVLYAEQIAKIGNAVKILKQFTSDSGLDTAQIARQIHQYEHDMDIIHNDINRKIERAINLPHDENHMKEVAMLIEDLMDELDDFSHAISTHWIKSTPELQKFVDLIADSYFFLNKMIELLATDDYRHSLESPKNSICAVEHEADELFRGIETMYYSEIKNPISLIEIQGPLDPASAVKILQSYITAITQRINHLRQMSIELGVYKSGEKTLDKFKAVAEAILRMACVSR